MSHRDFLEHNKSIAHYTSPKGKGSVLFLSAKDLEFSYISLMAKSDRQGACVIFRQSRSYSIFAITFPTGKISLCTAKYHGDSNITCRKANIDSGAAINPYRCSAKGRSFSSAGRSRFRSVSNFFRAPARSRRRVFPATARRARTSPPRIQGTVRP